MVIKNKKHKINVKIVTKIKFLFNLSNAIFDKFLND